MTSETPWLRTAVAVALSLAALRAQDETRPPKDAAPAAETAAKPIVQVLGASVSAGFVDPFPRTDGERNSTVKLARALASLWPDGAVEIRDQSDAFLFLDPEGVGKREVDRALDADAALVIGIDLPFWFGYGQVGTLAARKARQDRFFALMDHLLEKRPVPILLGDYPDMRGADPNMLPPGAVPSVEELRTLNQRLREWAGKHDSVHLFPLAEFVAAARGEGIHARFSEQDENLGSDLLMQSDRLHASRTGIAVLVTRITATLQAALGKDDALRPRDLVFEALADKLGATVEIEDWLDAHKAAAAGDGKNPAKSGGQEPHKQGTAGGKRG